MSSHGLGRKAVISSEEFATELDELLARAREGGAELRQRRLGDEQDDVRPRDQVTKDLLSDRLRELLEDEVVPAHELTGLLLGEFEREIQKKALVGLRMETLKKLARNQLLDERGGSEDLAQRIARAYHYDDAEIARLILDNIEEPTAETGHESRIFPLQEPVDVSTAEAYLRLIEKRMVRTGVARWLEIDALDATSARIDLVGQLRTYRAFINEQGDEPQLGSVPDAKSVKLRLEDGQQVLVAEDANVNVSRIAARGVAAVIKNEFPEDLPIIRALSGSVATFDERTAVLLDLIYGRLARIGITQQNLTVARFVTEKADKLAQADPEEAQEHGLKAVRFEGNHVLDSPQACQFIAVQQRGLVDVSLRVAVPSLGGSHGDVPWFPIRLTLERDHIGVMTGYGRHRPEKSGILHEQLMEQAQLAISDGPLDLDALNELGERIAEVARSGEPGSLRTARAGGRGATA